MCQISHRLISQQGNPFTMLSSQPITNIVTNAQHDVEPNTFLLQCLKLGETAKKNISTTRKKLQSSLMPSQKQER